MALLSWGEKMDPPLPLLVNPSLRRSTTNGDCFDQARSRKEAMDSTSDEAIPSHPGPLFEAVYYADTTADFSYDVLPYRLGHRRRAETDDRLHFDQRPGLPTICAT